MLVYVLAVGAALMFGIGSVIQQRVAFDAPPGKSLRPSLLLWLARQPLWLAGVGTALVGNGLSATALGIGSVALVQPLLVTRLLFALPLSAVWARQRLTLRDWAGVLAAAGGLGAFVAIGRPQPEGDGGGSHLVPWLVTAAVVGGLIALLVWMARRLRPTLEAPMLGAGAGMLFGMQSGLTHTAMDSFHAGGVTGILAAPSTYAVVVTAVLGTLLAQSAYEAAPLHASYPPLASVEPLAGIGIGVGVLGGTLTVGALPLTVEVVGLAVMTLGIYLLATSPLVAGQAEAMRRRQQEEAAARVEEQLDRDLDHLQRDLERLEHAGPRRERKVLDRLADESARMDELLEELSGLNEEAFDRAGLPSRTPEQQPDGEHQQVMEQWRAERCEREDALRARAERVASRLQRLRT